MNIPYTYWQSPDGNWLGCWSDYPDYWTQGKTLDELRKMLIALRSDIADFIRNGDLEPSTRSIDVMECV